MADMAWLVRPATRPQAGGGHVARCAALAIALKAHAPVLAALEAGGEGWAGRFNSAGVETIAQAALGNRTFTGIVLDDYELDAYDIAQWRIRASGALVQILDYGIPPSGIDLAVNATPGISGNRIGEVPALLGSTYAMLAPAYAGRPRPSIRERIERVIVGIGWIDQHGATERVLAALARVLADGTRVDVLLGSRSPNVDRVAALVAAHENWHLHRDADEPWRLLDGADIAFSGGGQSLLERLAFGIPTLALSVAANQRPALRGASQAGAVVDLGDLEMMTEDRISDAVASLIRDPHRRAALSTAAQELVDGRGAARVADRLAASRLS